MTEWKDIQTPMSSPAQRRAVYRLLGTKADLHQTLRSATADQAHRLISLLVEIIGGKKSENNVVKSSEDKD